MRKKEDQNPELAKLKRKLETAEEYAGNAAHELKSPLASMKVLADALLEQESVPEEIYREFLRDISSQIDRETRVIDDLLQLALLGRQNDGDEKQSVLLDDIVKQVENNISQAAIQKNISLHLNCQEHCHMYGSRQYLYDIILNLMENAVKYNVPDGKVFLDIKKKNGLLGIRVRDTGIGIGKHTGNDIFKRFYRENKEYSREQGGTGLGLAICKEAAEKMGGTIRYRSTEGEGSTFLVWIPVHNK